jgi:hypothetical protein
VIARTVSFPNAPISAVNEKFATLISGDLPTRVDSLLLRVVHSGSSRIPFANYRPSVLMWDNVLITVS